MAANAVPTPTLNVSAEKTPTESIIRCTGRVTLETAPQLQEIAKNLISQSQCVVLDFNEVNYLDSSGLGMIVGLLVSAKKSGCKLSFINLTPRVREIFTMTRLLEWLEAHAPQEGPFFQ